MKINTDSLFRVNCTMQDQCLLNKEYRKPTNTYLYLYTMLHYHLANIVCGVCLCALGWSHRQQKISMLESTYCRGTFMTVATAPNVMLPTRISQKSDHHKTTHNGNHLLYYPEHPQQNQQSNIQELHRDSMHCTKKNMWLCSSHDTENSKVLSSMLYKFVSPLGPGWMSTTITFGYNNWKSMQWWNTAVTLVYTFKARHPQCVFLH